MLIKSKYGYNTWTWKRPLNGFKFLFQRLTRGWDDSEVWNLDVTVAKFVLPRLRILRKLKHGYPVNLTEEQWEETMDKIILAFSLIGDGSGWDLDEDSVIHVEDGLDLFRKYYFNLWD